MIIFAQKGIDSLTAEERTQLQNLAAKAGTIHEERDWLADRLEALRKEEESNRTYREDLEKSFV